MAPKSTRSAILLDSVLLDNLIQELRKQDPLFQTSVVIDPEYARLRKACLLDSSHINDIVAYHPSVVVPAGMGTCTPDQEKALLHFAAESGDVPLVHELLRLGADIDIRDSQQETPLLLAAYLLCRLAHKKEKLSVLDEAMRYRTRIIVRLLIMQHADVNAVNSDGENVLILLSHGDDGYGPLVQLALNYGADPKLPIPCMDPMHQALTRTLFLAMASPGNHSRPPQPCPCWSGKLLSECHDGKELLSYPASALCPCCESTKPFGKCCERRQIRFVETWSKECKALVRWKNPHAQILRPNFELVPEERRQGVKELIEGFGDIEARMHETVSPAEFSQMVQLSRSFFSAHLVLEGKVDPAFRFAMSKIDFEPIPWGRMLSREECKNRQREHNEQVDEYIRISGDKRPAVDIERAAKIGLNGGAMYRLCEGPQCSKLEGRDIPKLQLCSKCKVTVYCSRNCSVQGWKAHKPICGTRHQRVQSLPSQEAWRKYRESTFGYLEPVEMNDAELREMLRSEPEKFLTTPWKG